jgi:hypothetical protein
MITTNDIRKNKATLINGQFLDIERDYVKEIRIFGILIHTRKLYHTIEYENPSTSTARPIGLRATYNEKSQQ